MGMSMTMYAYGECYVACHIGDHDILFPRVFFYTFFLIFAHLWWCWVGSWIGFLGLRLSVDGV